MIQALVAVAMLLTLLPARPAQAQSPNPGGRVFLPAVGASGLNMNDAAPSDRDSAMQIGAMLEQAEGAKLQRATGSRDTFFVLVYALAVTGVGSALLQTPEWTVFAPTDAAFAKLPAGTLASLIKPENRGVLKAILLYHALGSKVTAEQALALAPASVPTLNGAEIKLSVRNGALFINDSKVTRADVMAGSGRVFHVIDAVLIPPAAPTATPTPAVTATPTSTPTGSPTPTPTPAPLKDIVDTAVAAGSFNTLVAAVQAAGLVDALKAPGSLTVFVPNDAAFAKLPPELVRALLKPENKAKLVEILTYHVLAGKVLSGDAIALDGQQVEMLSGKKVSVSVRSGSLFINDSKVIAADVLATNGVIHVIDTVLIPPGFVPPPTKDIVDTAVAAGSFNTLVAAVQAAGLVDALKAPGPLTVFAPNDAAFAKLPPELVRALLKPENKAKLVEILTYHVLAGKVLSGDAIALDGQQVEMLSGKKVSVSVRSGSLFINDSKVIAADVLATNGVIHVIDTVLIPPGFVPPPTKDIVDTAVAAGSFNTLVAAVQAAGLVDALKGPGPLTVLAPSDAAFAKLPPKVIEALLKPENKEVLKAILLYHVIADDVTKAEAMHLSHVKTLNGSNVRFSRLNGALLVNGSKVGPADIVATNGRIHVIDRVLVPNVVILDMLKLSGNYTTLLAATKAAGLEHVFAQTYMPVTLFAPDDAAFAKLPAGTVESLLKPENKAKLVNILAYHVLPWSELSSNQLAARTSVTALNGRRITVAASSTGIKLNGAINVAAPDIDARNGIIHGIDAVLIPN